MEGTGIREGDERDDGEVGGIRELEFYTVLLLTLPTPPKGPPFDS